MKIKWNVLKLAVVFGLASFGIGCGGIGASGSVSPATFLLPGFGQNHPQNNPEMAPLEEVSGESSSATVAANAAHLPQ